MSEQAMSVTPAQDSKQKWASIAAWWQQTGEPVVLSGMVLCACTLPLLVLTDILDFQRVLRVMLGLGWVIGVMLLTRLPRLLHAEHRRIAMMMMLGVIVCAFALFANPGMPTQAESGVPHTAPRPYLLDGSNQVQDDGVVFAISQVQQETSLTFKAPPRISREMFAQLLWQGTGGAGTSPAAPYADELYDVLVAHELDPAVALAFFAQESQFCTTGICASHDMKNWGGNRAAFNRQRAAGIVYARSGPFVSYATWEDGLRDWCELILYRYIDRGLDTVEKAVPVYAPAFDGNDPSAYINAVYRRVAAWQGRDPDSARNFAPRSYPDLESALLSESFRANGLEYHPTWAFHRYVVAEARAGHPLGSPMGESREIIVGGKTYAIQTFALDTLYTPLAEVESQTNWSDVRRMSELLKQGLQRP